MSEEFNDNKTVHAQSSETISGGGSGVALDSAVVEWLSMSESIASLVMIPSNCWVVVEIVSSTKSVSVRFNWMHGRLTFDRQLTHVL